MTPAALLDELTRRGVTITPNGDKLRLRPAAALPPDLVEQVRAHKPEILTLLRQSRSSPADPWPSSLDGLGGKGLGAFKPCLWCGGGTWVRYAGLPTCLSCARAWPGSRNPDAVRAYLWRLLDLRSEMNETSQTEANVTALYNDIMDVFRDHPEADAWFNAWRAAHPAARLS